MNENIIYLQFEKMLTDLSGNRLGDNTYVEQVRGKIDVSKINIVWFPNTVEYVGSSFIQGMYKKLEEQYSWKEAREIMVLKSDNEKCKEKIEKSMKVIGV